MRPVHLLLSICLVLNGCSTTPVLVPNEQERRQFGNVGVVHAQFAPQDAFLTPLRGLVGGAAGGAAHGAFEALRAGLMPGDGGPVMLMLLPVFMITFAIIGAIIAVPEDTAQKIDASVARVFSTEPVQTRLFEKVVELVRRDTGKSVQALAEEGPGQDEKTPDYRALAAQGLDTILEVGVTRVGLAGAGGADPELFLFLEADARLVRTLDNKEIYAHKNFLYLSERLKFSLWATDDARPAREALQRAYPALAGRIVDTIFLEVQYEY
jgi:hypothetical protein